MATTSKSFGFAAAISRASASVRSAIDPLVEENLDLSVAAHDCDSVNDALSPGSPNFTSTSRTPAGGAAKRALNATRS